MSSHLNVKIVQSLYASCNLNFEISIQKKYVRLKFLPVQNVCIEMVSSGGVIAFGGRIKYRWLVIQPIA